MLVIVELVSIGVESFPVGVESVPVGVKSVSVRVRSWVIPSRCCFSVSRSFFSMLSQSVGIESLSVEALLKNVVEFWIFLIIIRKWCVCYLHVCHSTFFYNVFVNLVRFVCCCFFCTVMCNILIIKYPRQLYSTCVYVDFFVVVTTVAVTEIFKWMCLTCIHFWACVFNRDYCILI
jgi:hypothetical protein